MHPRGKMQGKLVIANVVEPIVGVEPTDATLRVWCSPTGA